MADRNFVQDIGSAQSTRKQRADETRALLAGDVDLARVAILLDVDGTLLDIAPSPHEIHAPKSLASTLNKLYQRTGGALALISGRPLADLDSIFAPLRLPAIGGHGAELRLSDHGEREQRHAEPLDDRLRQHLANIAKVAPGILVEDKGYAIALHYRRARELEGMLHKEVAAICARLAPAGIELLHGKAVIEVKSAHFNKGTALRELLTHAPFAGRQPIFVGDDVTDEDVFAVLPEMDGIGLSVGKAMNAISAFESPGEVREWLERMLGKGAGDGGM